MSSDLKQQSATPNRDTDRANFTQKVMAAWLLGIDPSVKPIEEDAVREMEVSR